LWGSEVPSGPNPRAVLKIDCGEFQHSHEVAKLIGSPPGYLGHRETHSLLSQEMLNQYHRHDEDQLRTLRRDQKGERLLVEPLLGILDKGTLTLGDNRKVDFSRSMIFMTSNLGAAEMSALISPKFGFGAREQFQSGAANADLDERIERTGVAAARRRFTPEFINRLDKIVTFKSLRSDHLSQILDIELKTAQQRIFNASLQRSFLF
jgi:ATP-dependent Clp protease ATP-binding subunit ClpB